MTFPKDPVIQWMESLGFVWREPGDGDSSHYWFATHDNSWITHEQATFFYQQMLEARKAQLIYLCMVISKADFPDIYELLVKEVDKKQALISEPK